MDRMEQKYDRIIELMNTFRVGRGKEPAEPEEAQSLF